MSGGRVRADRTWTRGLRRSGFLRIRSAGRNPRSNDGRKSHSRRGGLGFRRALPGPIPIGYFVLGRRLLTAKYSSSCTYGVLVTVNGEVAVPMVALPRTAVALTVPATSGNNAADTPAGAG